MHEARQMGSIIQNRYRILEVLGQGGSGITYRAEQVTTGYSVALKELSLKGLNDWKKLTLFEREAKVLANLDHPAIPKYVDYFQVDTADNRFFYITQELVEGKSLADLVMAGQRFSEAEIQRIALAILQILQYLHRLNPPVIHRDIKPQNIIRRADGHIFLVDFGSVQTVYWHTIAYGHTIVGTYGYMAPEQFQGEAKPATDLYGLGATLLYLLTHRLPADLPKKRLKCDFRPYINVSPAFADWLDGLLEPLAEDRFDAAESAIAAITPSPTPQTGLAALSNAQPQHASESILLPSRPVYAEPAKVSEIQIPLQESPITASSSSVAAPPVSPNSQIQAWERRWIPITGITFVGLGALLLVPMMKLFAGTSAISSVETSTKFSAMPSISVISDASVASTSLNPDTFGTFFDWCINKNSLPQETQKTVDALL